MIGGGVIFNLFQTLIQDVTLQREIKKVTKIVFIPRVFNELCQVLSQR